LGLRFFSQLGPWFLYAGPLEDFNLRGQVPSGGARAASGERWPYSGEQAAMVGFGLTLSRLAWLAWRESAPAMVVGEGGGRRLRRPQCRRAGGSSDQCVCTGAFQRVRVEAKVELGLEQRRWLVGRTGELGAAVTAVAGERRGEAPEQCEGRGVVWGVGGA
jgi:hypothetical protein